METNVFSELNSKRTDWSMASKEEIIIRNYYIILDKVTKLEKLKGQSKSKYGKIIYLFDKGQVLVFRKYPRELLYQGNL